MYLFLWTPSSLVVPSCSSCYLQSFPGSRTGWPWPLGGKSQTVTVQSTVRTHKRASVSPPVWFSNLYGLSSFAADREEITRCFSQVTSLHKLNNHTNIHFPQKKREKKIFTLRGDKETSSDSWRCLALCCKQRHLFFFHFLIFLDTAYLVFPKHYISSLCVCVCVCMDTCVCMCVCVKCHARWTLRHPALAPTPTWGS